MPKSSTTFLATLLLCLLSANAVSIENDKDVKPTYFFENYVLKNIPVILPDLLKEISPKVDLTATGLSRSGVAAISITEIVGESVPATLMSIFGDKKPFQDLPLHSNLKTVLVFPPILRCNPLLTDLLFNTSHSFAGVGQEVTTKALNKDGALPPPTHQLKCLVEGQSKFSVAGLSSEEVDLKGGDCIFVPSNWKIENLIGGHWITIRWIEAPEGLYCKDEIKAKPTFADRKWPGEGIVDVIERTIDRKRTSNQFLIHLIDNFILKEIDGGMEFEDFVKQASVDAVLVPDLPKWNEECTEAAKELFGHLDRNQDEKLNIADLKDLDKADLNHWAGLVHDRVQDLADIIYDMRVDWAGNLPPNPRIPEAKEFIDRTEKFFEEMEKEKLEKKLKQIKDEL